MWKKGSKINLVLRKGPSQFLNGVLPWSTTSELDFIAARGLWLGTTETSTQS